MVKSVWQKGLFILVFGMGMAGALEVPLEAQVGVDFNKGDFIGSVNLTTYYRAYHDFGGIVSGKQSSLHLALNSFLWLGRQLSTRFSFGVGQPLVGAESVASGVAAHELQYFYEGEFSLRLTLLKANVVAMMLGVLLDSSEGHVGGLFLSAKDSASVYLQTGLGVEFEVAFALGLEHLLYTRLKVPVSTYNSVVGKYLEWGFYPRQGSLELGLLFHKGPSFGLTKTARNIYFGLFYRLDVRTLKLPPASLIASHTVGFTYYVKPPF